ncbi:hypothetical protein CYMTET_55963 [Cymbomonas tetramitiformis]|uniref:Uncharacterized protein n=1 Tax=Cymbomonas tetramitiformis TaxID=36881 RepID=A0AAE0BC85_9CHLO|nr:hypothetical protein CYMTET_55963 [Cymbomonas tetramitiformis]
MGAPTVAAIALDALDTPSGRHMPSFMAVGATWFWTSTARAVLTSPPASLRREPLGAESGHVLRAMGAPTVAGTALDALHTPSGRHMPSFMAVGATWFWTSTARAVLTSPPAGLRPEPLGAKREHVLRAMGAPTIAATALRALDTMSGRHMPSFMAVGATWFWTSTARAVLTCPPAGLRREPLGAKSGHVLRAMGAPTIAGTALDALHTLSGRHMPSLMAVGATWFWTSTARAVRLQARLLF